MPKSGIVVLPRITAPASRTRAAGGASEAAGVRSLAAVPSGVGTPRVAMFSLMVIGTPSSAPLGAPAFQRASDALAWVRAPSGSKAYIAFSFGSQASMRAMTASTTSTGDRVRAL